MAQAEDPPGMRVTLAQWAEQHGRTLRSVYTHWKPHPDFPAPVGRRPRPTGGGTAFDEYDLHELETWLTSQPRKRPPPPIVFAGPPDELVTLSAFASRARSGGNPVDGKTVYQCRGRPGFPAPVQGSSYRAGDVLTFLNSRRPGSGNRARGKRRKASHPRPATSSDDHPAAP
jgi:hypothetical protein